MKKKKINGLYGQIPQIPTEKSTRLKKYLQISKRCPYNTKNGCFLLDFVECNLNECPTLDNIRVRGEGQ